MFRVPTVLEGLVWAVIGGAAAAALEFKDAYGKWTDYQVDYTHIAQEASTGAIGGGVLFLRDLARRKLIAEGASVAGVTGPVPPDPPAAPGG